MGLNAWNSTQCHQNPVLMDDRVRKMEKNIGALKEKLDFIIEVMKEVN